MAYTYCMKTSIAYVRCRVINNEHISNRKKFYWEKKHVIFINIFESFVICKQFVEQNIEIKLN